MANVSQKISSYVHGISQQPDHLKKAGQVRYLLNGLPDVTEGLIKRPGSEVISDLGTSTTGKWFTIFRDANEKYICQVANGGLRVWSLIDGLPRVVRYNSTPDLEKPEDGGVGIDPDFSDTVDGTNPDPPAIPPTIPSTPPPTGGSPGIPSSCNLAALTAASNNVVDATNHRSTANTNYQNAVNDYNHKVANKQYIGVVSVCQPPVSNTYGQGGVWLVASRPQVAPDGYQLGPLKYRAQLKWPGQSNLVLQNGYDLLGTIGTYTQAQINDAAAVRDSNYNALVQADQRLEQAKVAYANEEFKCKAVTRTLELRRNVSVPYLAGTSPEDIDTLTLNDYTFLVNRKTVVSMGKDASSNRPHEAFVEIKNLEYNTEYALTITRPSSQATKAVSYAKTLTVSPADWTDEDGNSVFTETKTFDRNDGSRKNLRYSIETRGYPIPDGNYDYDAKYNTYITLLNGGEGWVVGDTWTVDMKGKTYTVRVDTIDWKYTYDALVPIAPYLTPKDPTAGIIKPEAIISHFKAEIGKVANWYTQAIGNGLYIQGPEEFSVYVSGGRSDGSIAALTNKVNNIGKLPVQCKDGYLVQILNTGETDDDYYVKFVGTRPGVDGAGAWEETVAPGVVVNFNYTTMPHQIVRMPDGTFMVSPVDWEKRLVGDRKTNPVPSFVGRHINKLFFYRNRLGVLSDENVILSRAGDFFNFFSKTALTVSESDPIDLATSSTTPCVLHDAVPLNPGLILFSREKQFILTTNQDLLTPSTTKLDVLSTYSCSEILPAFEMGTTVGFLAQAGKYSRMWEMTGLNQQGTPEVIEQSKIVQDLLPSNITDIANSKDNTIILFGIRGSKDIAVYRYFNDGEKRIQSAWFHWTAPGELVYHAVDDDTYYSVCHKDNKVYLAKTNLVPMSADQLVVSDVTYSPRLDLRHVVPFNDIKYDFRTETSSFHVPYKYTSDAYVFGLGNGRSQGRGSKILSIVQDGTKWKVTIPGNWSDNFIVIGYQYTMQVTLPHTYYTSTSDNNSATDTRMYTNVHRVKFEFGKVGLFDITVNKVGKADFKSLYEQSPADNYDADTHEVLATAIHTVPVYEKNLNFYIDLKSTYPTPCTLLSSMWEGVVSPKSYKSV